METCVNSNSISFLLALTLSTSFYIGEDRKKKGWEGREDGGGKGGGGVLGSNSANIFVYLEVSATRFEGV